MTRLFSLLLSVLLVAGIGLGCDQTAPDDRRLETYSFSFEQGMENWSAQALDVRIGGDTIEWAVEPTSEYAAQGNRSIRLFAENRTDAAKVWAERAFELEPNTLYRVEVEYKFGTSDWGDVNNWKIISGAHATPPRTHEALVYHGDTAHDQDTKDLVWLDKEYALGPVAADKSQTLTARTDPTGELYVTIGVWGTYEVGRTYYVDDVTVRFEPLQ